MTFSLTNGRLILDLCGGTGDWSAPYRAAGYEVLVVDPHALATTAGGGVASGAGDVRLFAYLDGRTVHGILAAPPCTDFAVSGARWWAGKGEQALLDSLAVADACIRIAFAHKPRWWVLENPIGRLAGYIGPPRFIFDPCDFGDAYTKRTCLWGDFTIPTGTRVEPTEGSKMHLVAPGPDRQRIRSATPPGFSQAFFLANP